MRLLQNRLENRLHVARRRIDDPQHLGSGGLLFERLLCLCDKPGVVHRDDRLRRETLEQRYLFVGERSYLLTVNSERAEQNLLAAERDGKERATAGDDCVF